MSDLRIEVFILLFAVNMHARIENNLVNEVHLHVCINTLSSSHQYLSNLISSFPLPVGKQIWEVNGYIIAVDYVTLWPRLLSRIYCMRVVRNTRDNL